MTTTDENQTTADTQTQGKPFFPSVSRAYGEPIVAQGRTIIPVAMVFMGFKGRMMGGRPGGRPGSNPPADQNTAKGPFGNRPGMGGMMRKMVVRPVGFIDLTNSGSRFVPIAPGRFVALGFAIAIVLGGIMRMRRRMMMFHHRG